MQGESLPDDLEQIPFQAIEGNHSAGFRSVDYHHCARHSLSWVRDKTPIPAFHWIDKYKQSLHGLLRQRHHVARAILGTNRRISKEPGQAPRRSTARPPQTGLTPVPRSTVGNE